MVRESDIRNRESGHSPFISRRRFTASERPLSLLRASRDPDSHDEYCTKPQVTFFVLFLSALAGWLAFWLDLALVLIARHKVTDHATGAQVISGHIGKAVWFALGGIVSCLASYQDTRNLAECIIR